MANINLSKSYKVERLEGFGGIRCGSGKVKTADMVNFRIAPDGSLKKRSGYKRLFEAPTGLIRDYYVASETLVFMFIGGRLYAADPSVPSNNLIQSFSHYIFESAFFGYGDSIYLISGTELYIYSGEEFVPVEGYIPLYGKEWHPTTGGKVNEPFNMFSSRIRISFKMPDPVVKRMEIPYGIEKLESILINGEPASLSSFGVSESKTVLVTIADVVPGDVIEVCFCPSSTAFKALRTKAAAYRKAASFGFGHGGGEPASLALWNNGQSKNTLLLSRHIDPEQLAHAKTFCSDIKPIYFSEHNTISISDGDGEITAACRSGENLAVFTKNSAYLLTETTDGAPKLISMSQGEGCTLLGGAVALDNAPVTVSGNRVLYWSPSHVYDNEYTATCISEPIADILPSTNITHFTFNKSKCELWFRFENDARTWIYNTSLKCWYSFDGFTPEHMFNFGGIVDIAFISNGKMYGFSDSVTKDLLAQPIYAAYTTEPIAFGDINRRKRLSRVNLSLTPGESLDFLATDALGSTANLTLKDTSGEITGYSESRINIRRSRYYTVHFAHSGGAVNVYSMTLSAVK